MSERLETLVKNNRKAFDQFEVPGDLWDKIDRQLDELEKNKPKSERVIKLKLVIWSAAAIIIAGVAGLLFFNHERESMINMATISPRLAREQQRYSSLIQYKREELVQIKTQEPELYKEFRAELEKLDMNYNKLQSGLAASPNQEATLKAMVRNLKAQSEILNQQLKIIEQVKQIKKGQHDENKSI